MSREKGPSPEEMGIKSESSKENSGVNRLNEIISEAKDLFKPQSPNLDVRDKIKEYIEVFRNYENNDGLLNQEEKVMLEYNLQDLRHLIITADLSEVTRDRLLDLTIQALDTTKFPINGYGSTA